MASYSYTPGTVVNVNNGGGSVPGGIVDSVQYNLDGTNFGGFGLVDTGTFQLTLTNYTLNLSNIVAASQISSDTLQTTGTAMIGANCTAPTFNNVPLTAAGSVNNSLREDGTYAVVPGAAFTEQGIKVIDLGVAAVTNIIDSPGVNQPNIVYDQATQQFKMDFTNYIGADDSVRVVINRLTSINNGVVLVIRQATGGFEYAPGLGVTQFFLENPGVDINPAVPLDTNYQFDNLFSDEGNSWHLFVNTYGDDTINPVIEQSLWLSATQGYFGGANRQLIIEYQYKLF